MFCVLCQLYWGHLRWYYHLFVLFTNFSRKDHFIQPCWTSLRTDVFSKQGRMSWSVLCKSGNAEANFGDKLSPSLSGMNNLSYTNSQIRFLVNFKTSNATFGVQNSKICEEIINVEFVYFKEFLCKHMLEIQIKKFACKFILIECCVLSYVLSKCLLEVRHSHTGYKIQHRESLFPVNTLPPAQR